MIRILTTRRRVVVALAAFVVLVVLNRARTASASLSLGDATVRASGPVTSGAQIEISASADQADTGGFAALAPPVHIEVRDGELSGPATLEFALAKPLPEGAVAVVATRTKDAGWRMAAGDYDQGRRTITVEVTHFSDWLPGAIDRQQIQRDLETQQRIEASSLSAWFGRSLVGSTPALTCVGPGPLVEIFVNDPAKLTKACMQVERPGRTWRMEIVNGHSVPFRMNLPSSVTAVPRDDAPLGSVPDFFGRLYEQKHPSEVLIPAESKRVFHVDPHALESPVELYGNIEWDILAAELVLWAINLAAKNAASRDVKRETAGLKEFEQWYGTADDINEVFSARSRWLVKPVRRRRPGSRHAEDRQVTQRAWSPR